MNTNAHQVVVDNARVLTNTIVNELRVGYNKFFNHAGGELNNVLRPHQRDWPPLPTPIPPDAWGTPSIAVAGFSGFGDNSESPFVNRNANLQIIDNLSWTRGKHFLKFGGEVRFDHYDQDGNQFARGSAGFANNVATGNAFADYLLGYLGTWSYASGLAVARLHAVSQAYYVSDTWKIRPTVTINLGLRYEFIPPWTDSTQRQIVADIPLNTPQPQVPIARSIRCSCAQEQATSMRTPTSGISPDIQVTRDGRFGDRPIKADYTNFAPRLGVAWSPTDKWAVRAGAGRFYVQDIGNIVFDKNRNLNGRLTVQSTATNLISTWQDPFNFGGSNPCNTPAGIVCVVRPLVLTDQIDRKTPYVDQYEAIVERQLATTQRSRSVISRPKATSCNGGSTWRTSRCLAPRPSRTGRHFRSSACSKVRPTSATLTTTRSA